MESSFTIRPLEAADIPLVTAWARAEGFSPGAGDLDTYRHTDRQGLWVGCLNGEPIGCIAGVRYNPAYGFIGLFLVKPEHRGQGYGVRLWKRAMEHLAGVQCIGIEAAPGRIADYAGWGFRGASPTRRWRREGAAGEAAIRPAAGSEAGPPAPGAAGGEDLTLLEGPAIPEPAVQAFDAARHPTPRPHFLADWLHHPAGRVLAVADRASHCHGFGRIRPCLLPAGEGWRIGPLLADGAVPAERLLRGLLAEHPGAVLIDAPAVNVEATALLERLGFQVVGETLRMYRGPMPTLPLGEVYGLACLELG